MKFSDPIEEIGREVLMEAVSRENKKVGDGSSTTAVLTAAILSEGMKHLGESSPMEMKKSLEDCLPLIEKSVNEQKRDIIKNGKIDLKLLEQVATIASEDPKMGKMVAEIYSKIGPQGVISWDISKTADDSYSLGTGITVNGATYAAPYMCDDNSQEVRIKNPHVLLARKKITSALDFENLFPILFGQEIKEIVIFCEDIDVQVIADLYKTQRIRGFRTVVIKMPVLWRDEWWEDLALSSGGTIIDMASGIKINEATMAHLGSFENIRVDREDTYIDGIKDISHHILGLQVDGSDKALIRASRLNTKTARYFVGAYSDSALKHRRDKLEDCLGSCSCALDNGIVCGGGLALANTVSYLGVKYRGDTIGARILQVAVRKPMEQIIKNAGAEPDKVMKKVKSENDAFDSRTGKIVNMFKQGIVDPADVVLNAVRSAVGVAAQILTCSTVITLPKEDEKPEMPSLLRR
jgi:chaperonin GroEL